MSTAPTEREGSDPDRAVELFIATQLKQLKDQLGTDSTESPTDNEIERFLKRVHLLAENPVPEILNGLLGLQIESALKKRPVVAKGIDRCVECSDGVEGDQSRCVSGRPGNSQDHEVHLQERNCTYCGEVEGEDWA